MSLATNLQNAFTRVATEFKSIRTLISGSGTGNVSGLDTTATNLVDAINEIFAGGGSGGVASLDDLTDVILTSVATGHTIRYDGAHFVNVDPTVYLQPRDTQLDTWATIDLDTDGALAANSDAKVASQKATKSYVDALINAANATVYKGAIDASANPNYPAADSGHLYRISVAGKIGGAAGAAVEAGDMIICFVDGSAAGTQAAVGANWDIVQANIDGAVVGPATSTNNDFATFNGTTGKVIKDSGLALDTDTTLAANSDTKIPSQKAVKGYTYSQTQLGDPATDFVATFEAGLL